MVSDEEYLERIVAGIQSLTTTGLDAEVEWNARIERRQFDVAVRFSLGLVKYLVLIEVKNKSRRIEATDIEAFVTKARDKRGNKIIFVSSVGFQRSAIEVANEHGVDLFTVTFNEKKVEFPTDATFILASRMGRTAPPPTLTVGEAEPVTRVIGVRIHYVDGSVVAVPSEPSQMHYYLTRTKLEDGRQLDSIIRTGRLPHPTPGAPLLHKVDLGAGVTITPPDTHFFPFGHVMKLECDLEYGLGRQLSGNVKIDPGAFTLPVVYTNALTGEAFEFPIYTLPLGPRKAVAGQFYFADHPLRYLYCEAANEKLVKWKQIESFQAGELVRWTYAAKQEFSHFYIPVTDRTILKRLRARLEEYNALLERDRRRQTA